MYSLYRALVFTSLFVISISFSAYGAGIISVKDGIATSLQPNGQASVPASCFVIGELCSVEEVRIGFPGPDAPGPQPPPTAGPALALDCSHVGFNVVRAWVRNALGQWTAYETAVLLQDNFDVCQGGTFPLEAPSLQANLGLAYGIDGSGETVLRASDFVAAYSLPNGGTPLFSFSQSPADSLLTLTCADIGTIPVSIYLLDIPTGGLAVTYTYALLNDETGLCTSGGAGSSFPVYNGLVYVLPPEGQIALRVEDFLPCCSGGDITYAFSPNPADNLYFIDCDDAVFFPANITLPIYGIGPDGSYSVSSTYFVLHDSYDYCTQSSFVPANDDACNAIAIEVGPSPCPMAGTNFNATAQAGEPAPPDGDCQSEEAWCDGQGAENSVWFSFEAPPSGSITIRANYFNTQLALWEADSCQAITAGGAILVAANDDIPGSSRGEAMLNSIRCLVPGKTYYLQVDGFNGESGPFELLLEDAGLACGPGEGYMDCTDASNTPIASGANIWRHAFDGGRLIASIADGGNPMGAIRVQYQVNNGDVRLDGAGAPYLDRNWAISTEQQPLSPVRLRLYFTAEEFQSLQAAATGIDTPAGLALTRVPEGECGPYTGGGELINQEGFGQINETDYYVDFLTPGFSAFYLHGPEPLISTLEAAQGKTAIRIVPNPLQGGVAVLEAAVEGMLEANLLIYSTSGQAVGQQRIVLQKGQNRLPVTLGSLQPGVYILKLTGPGLSWSSRLVTLR